ncbi:hypothetical protein glysoja_029657, partial [Glycine soja]
LVVFQHIFCILCHVPKLTQCLLEFTPTMLLHPRHPKMMDVAEYTSHNKFSRSSLHFCMLSFVYWVIIHLYT